MSQERSPSELPSEEGEKEEEEVDQARDDTSSTGEEITDSDFERQLSSM